MNMETRWGIALVVLGGVVWGLVGLGYFLNTNLNVINLVLGSWPLVENLVYVAVGICALWVAYAKLGRKA